MTRHTPLWEQSGSYAASDDRGLLSALWPGPAVTGCAVLPPASGMTVTVDPGYAAVPSANGTGTVLCHSDAVETVADFLPAPPAGTDRTDLVVCQSRGATVPALPGERLRPRAMASRRRWRVYPHSRDAGRYASAVSATHGRIGSG